MTLTIGKRTLTVTALADLAGARRGENWTPLRRLVATAPSIRACAP